jgi:hypothetical protein
MHYRKSHLSQIFGMTGFALSAAVILGIVLQ